MWLHSLISSCETILYLLLIRNCTYFLLEFSPALTGFLSELLFTYFFSFSALSRYVKHLALILSLAFSLCASSKIKTEQMIAPDT